MAIECVVESNFFLLSTTRFSFIRYKCVTTGFDYPIFKIFQNSALLQLIVITLSDLAFHCHFTECLHRDL